MGSLEHIREKLELRGKLKHIYELNSTIINEIDQFWAGVDVPDDELHIDTDNLLGVYIFVILRSHFP